MRAQFQTVRIVDERIACDARLFVVRLAETAVDDDQFPLRLDRALPVFFLDGDVPVDDMAVFSVNAEIAQYFFAERLVVAVAVIGVALFLMVFFVVYVNALEGGQFFAAEKRRALSAPEIPDKVQRFFVRFAL